ncbi:MAG TPA: nucleotide exchange factor GrpE [Longimicrobiales bacterium]|nr:nucleotide exchange factor GrpE [Longimicrobiales bacterium]
MSEDMGPRDDREAGAEESGQEHAALQVQPEGEGEEASRSAEVEELRGELDSLNDRHLRLAAEFDNYRKRNERDRHALAARLQVDLVRPMLDVLDDLERVIESGAAADADALTDGVRLVEKKLRGALEAAGLESLDADGQPFDPAVMEALMTVPTADPAEDDRVADVFQKGYRFGGTLVRPARVRVLKYDETAGE